MSLFISTRVGAPDVRMRARRGGEEGCFFPYKPRKTKSRDLRRRPPPRLGLRRRVGARIKSAVGASERTIETARGSAEVGMLTLAFRLLFFLLGRRVLESLIFPPKTELEVSWRRAGGLLSAAGKGRRTLADRNVRALRYSTSALSVGKRPLPSLSLSSSGYKYGRRDGARCQAAIASELSCQWNPEICFSSSSFGGRRVTQIKARSC